MTTRATPSPHSAWIDTSALSAPTLTCDIFCRVVDNFGDIGVAWRLARQLSREHGIRVRLIVDDLSRFHGLVPAVEIDVNVQTLYGVAVFDWHDSLQLTDPADIVIETFGCDLPRNYQAAMARMSPPPVWINLEYLSAEPWVAAHHLMPSPHPALPLTKHFFFPGFTAETGGLLREREMTLLPAGKSRRGPIRVFIFGYDHAPIEALIKVMSVEATTSGAALNVGIIEGSLADKLNNWRGIAAESARKRPPMLEFDVLPFVPQSEFDDVLRSHDILFVRGEDSFVRAQWVAKPLVWHIYPQADNAHLVKLNAFLELYCEALPSAAANAMRSMWLAWNEPSPGEIGAAWRAFVEQLPVLSAHAERWAQDLSKTPDLASRLLSFCRENAKIQGFAAS